LRRRKYRGIAPDPDFADHSGHRPWPIDWRKSMTVPEIIKELQSLGSEAIKRVLMNHGAREPIYGVKVEDLKRIQKRVKVDHQLALDLYDTGVYDAMYLAGLIADDAKMTRTDLQRWLDQAYTYAFSEYTVPWVATGNPHGHALAQKWIESKKEPVAAAGWCTIAGLVLTRPDDELDLAELKTLLKRIETTIHDQPNRVRHTMNGFVIAVGSAVVPLADRALAVAEKVGKVSVNMGHTACKVPFAPEYIRKVHDKGGLGKKRKTMKC
jgi:3-methyladenine DNA glycosylase AlkD